MVSTRTLPLLALAALTLNASLARAHGGDAQAIQVRFDPSSADVAIMTSRALVLGTAEEGFRWICRRATDSTAIEEPRMEYATDGALVVVGFRGLVRGAPGGCSWSAPSAELDATVVIDITRAPDDGALYALTSSGSAANDLFRSDDQGQSWDDLGAPGATLLLDRVHALGQRIVLSGTDLRGSETGGPLGAIYVSDDQGRSFVRHEFPLTTDERAVELLAIDPADPDRLFARVRGREENGASLGDRLVESRDAGASWSTRLSLGTLLGFAFDPTSRRVWVGGPHPSLPQGLWRGDLDELDALTLIDAELPIYCLAFHAGGLWACSSETLDETTGEPFRDDAFGLGLSADGGETFAPIWRQAELLGPLACEDDTLAATCHDEDVDLVDDLALPISLEETPGGCSAGRGPADGNRASGSSLAFALLGLLGLLAFRRRR